MPKKLPAPLLFLDLFQDVSDIIVSTFADRLGPCDVTHSLSIDEFERESLSGCETNLPDFLCPCKKTRTNYKCAHPPNLKEVLNLCNRICPEERSQTVGGTTGQNERSKNRCCTENHPEVHKTMILNSQTQERCLKPC